jgi:lysophospholipase L1-like esterase
MGAAGKPPRNRAFTLAAHLPWFATKDRFANARFAERADALAPDGSRRIVAVAEGDSWFDYPPHLDLIDHLQALGYVNAWRESHYGHTLEEMAGKQLSGTLAAIRTHRPDVLLLSCGGNDIMGANGGVFGRYLRAAASRASPADPYLDRKGITAAFYTQFAGQLNRIFDDVLTTAAEAGKPELRIFIHGYDYGFPDGRALFGHVVPGLAPGPWLAPALKEHGYLKSLRPSAAEIRAGHTAMKEVIDYYNVFLQGLADERGGRVVHVDFRGSLPDRKRHWANETHPTASGFALLARRMNDAVKEGARRE